jgi:hypothetical protein
MKIFENIRIPGALWLALIAGMIHWLPQIVPDAPWLPIALLILAALGKAVEVLVAPRIASLDPSPVNYYANTTSDQVRGGGKPMQVTVVRYAGKVRSFFLG